MNKLKFFLFLTVMSLLLSTRAWDEIHAQAGEVHILVIDDFIGRTLGFIPESRETGQAIYDAVQTAFAQIAASATPDPSQTPDPSTTPDPSASILDPVFNQVLSQFGDDILTGIRDELPAGQEDVTSDTACIGFMPEFFIGGQGHYITQGAGPDDPGPHGDVVMNTIKTTAEHTSLQVNAADPMNLELMLADQSASIHVLGMDTDHFTLSKAEEAIVNTVQGTTGSWVINASFAVIPCEQVAVFSIYEAMIAAAEDNWGQEHQHFRAAVERLIGAYTNLPEGFRADQVSAAECNSFSLCEWLSGQDNVILVGAAGNIGLDFPYYPAGYPNAVSVSASDENEDFFSRMSTTVQNCAPGTPGTCSNAGEVMMPGIVDYRGVSAFGTSFAAPRLSLWLAGYFVLTGGQNECMLLTEPFNNRNLDQLMGDLGCDPLSRTGPEVFGVP